MHILMPKDRKTNYRLTVFSIMAFTTIFFIWAYFAEIDEVVKGHGKVVTNSQNQILQHLEGGIISDIAVKEGDRVKKGAVIYRLNQAFFDANLREKEIETKALKVRALRLEAMLEGVSSFDIDETLTSAIPEIVENERKIFIEKMNEYNSTIKRLEQEAEQKRFEIVESESKMSNLERELSVAKESLEITEQLLKSKATSKQEYLRELSRKQSLTTEVDNAKNRLPVLKEELSQAELKIESERSKIRSELLKELSEVNLKIKQLQETNKAIRDRSLRSEIVSPTEGVVNSLYFHTVGGIIKPGDKVAEITPIEDSLMIEAKIKPSDRADIWVGQKASIEITAYNFSKYGLLEGVLTNISADAFSDEQGQSYYRIFVKTNENSFGKDNPILPGMLANVNILTGKKTVLEYIFVPLKKIAKNSLVEK